MQRQFSGGTITGRISNQPVKGVRQAGYLGEILRSRRLSLGLTLEDVEEETKIRKYYLEALEENNYDLLLPWYASGFATLRANA